MRKRRSFHSSAGVTLIETAFTLPIVVAVIMMFLWIGYVYNARNGLVSAIGNGTRLAFTRGLYKKPNGEGLLSSLDLWWQSGSEILPELLSNQDSSAANSVYNDLIVNQQLGSTLKDVPVRYHYAIVYTIQAMKETVGGQLLYPCLDGQVSCMTCYPLNPEMILESNENVYPGENGFGIECEFRPGKALVRFVGSLLSIFGENSNGPEYSIKKAVFY